MVKFIKRMQKKLTPHEKQARFMVNNPAYAPYQIGAWTYGAPRVYTWNKGATLKIGKFCSIAGGVKIYLDGEHRTDWVTNYPFSYLFEKAAHIEGHPKAREMSSSATMYGLPRTS